MKAFLFVAGVALAVFGLVLPVPGPLDDPIDCVGYFLMIISVISKVLEE
jgi:hypothetical protein